MNLKGYDEKFLQEQRDNIPRMQSETYINVYQKCTPLNAILKMSLNYLEETIILFIEIIEKMRFLLKCNYIATTVI